MWFAVRQETFVRDVTVKDDENAVGVKRMFSKCETNRWLENKHFSGNFGWMVRDEVDFRRGL